VARPPALNAAPPPIPWAIPFGGLIGLGLVDSYDGRRVVGTCFVCEDCFSLISSHASFQLSISSFHTRSFKPAYSQYTSIADDRSIHQPRSGQLVIRDILLIGLENLCPHSLQFKCPYISCLSLLISHQYPSSNIRTYIFTETARSR
jgi:hypothetical protein